MQRRDRGPASRLRGPAAVLLLALAAGAQAWPTVPLPERSRGEAVSRHMKDNGLDMRASRFVAPGSVDQVVAFYAMRWPGRHVVDRVEGRTIVGHADGNHYVTVELRPAGDSTEGTIGIMRMPAAGEVPVLGAGFPVTAGTEVISDIEHLDTPTRARTLVLGNGLSPWVNRQEYSRRLRAQGWQDTGGTACRPSGRSCVAGFEHPSGGKMAMTLSRGDGVETSIVVNIE